MSRLAALLDEAVARGDVPFAVAMVGDADGVLWEGASGSADGSRAAGPETVLQLWSMSKAVGAVMAMIAVDRGELALDTPVVEVLPEFARIGVLAELGADGPVYRPPRRPVTLGHLLSHTSGLAYDTFDARQMAHQVASSAERIGSGRKSSWFHPLMFDPGDEFAYGIGSEWAALMVSVADGRPIERFCREEVLDPLGMSDTGFEPDGRRDRLAVLRARRPDGSFAGHGLAPPPRPEVYGMGSALYGTTSDYLRFLRFVLRRGELDGVRLIRDETAELLFANRIGGLSVAAMPSQLPAISEDLDWFPEVRTTWTTAFMRVEEDLAGRRRAGSLSWAGLLNTHYWIDPVSDIVAVFDTQLLPFCDRRCMDVLDAFERAVYSEIVGPAPMG